jgi:DNA invertase Pin-like site-specific DNA recombinase
MKLVGYIRVSSDSQEDNTSLSFQRERIEKYCLGFGHELSEIFIEVESGKNTKNRPEFQKAILAMGDCDGLIVMKIDRLARNTKETLQFIDDEIIAKNKNLIVIDLEVNVATPNGRMVLTMMSSVAEMELNTIRERTNNGRIIAMEKGVKFGAAKFGESVQSKTRVENDDEIKIIGLIKRHRKAGKGYAAIATLLNKKGYPTKQGKQWHATTVKNILDRLSPAKAA